MGVLDGRVAVVTGAGRGLGRAHALCLASQGARVVVNDPDPGDGTPSAERVVAEIREAGGEAAANLSSCADWKGAEGLIAQAVDNFGDLDILVNNAGIIRDKMSFNMSEDEFDAVVNVHLKGQFAPSHFAAAHWRAQGKTGQGNPYGRIINTTSESAFLGLPGQSNYSAAKAGIIGLTMVLARELERIGVTANVIAPRARTPMTESTFSHYRELEEGEFDDRAPENVSPVVAWLASPEAATITGQVFVSYGSTVALLASFDEVATIDAGGVTWDVDDLVEAGPELFAGGRSSGVRPMPEGIG